ncbi:Hypothetical protein PACV_179 [Pacmanvirus A23]|uniref:Hypothetical protein n=1 Tax=Pacmanvirus A23 TaxID=1932881 RepID=UPI000A096004|nr:Hypothetical protein B9W72_gp177 [Pacmanvirus A23]SIP85894.1 Hypothetical protein PACV_179 [Pacmanvirus A23]
MALQLFPPFTPMVKAAQGTKLASETVFGEEATQKGRDNIISGWSTVMAFVPINPMLIPFQMASFILLSIIFIFLFGMGLGKGVLLAYLLQAFLTWMLAKKIMNFAWSFGLGV